MSCRWRCRVRKSESPAKSGGSGAKPAIGPVVPLSAIGSGEGGELLGGGRPAHKEADQLATRVLSHGEALAAPPSRADDFSWPRTDAKANSDTVPDAAPAQAAPPAAGSPAAPKGAGKNETNKTDANKTDANKRREQERNQENRRQERAGAGCRSATGAGSRHAETEAVAALRARRRAAAAAFAGRPGGREFALKSNLLVS